MRFAPLLHTERGLSPRQIVVSVEAATTEGVRSTGIEAPIIPEVDAFCMWGFPFESMADFHKLVFQMVLFRSCDVRVLPCLLSFLPQTKIYLDYLAGKYGGTLTFRPDLTPEHVVTGHETSSAGHIAIAANQQPLFDFVAAHAELFPGFLQWEPQTNVQPKLQVLRDLAFYSPVSGQADSSGKVCALGIGRALQLRDCRSRPIGAVHVDPREAVRPPRA